MDIKKGGKKDTKLISTMKLRNKKHMNFYFFISIQHFEKTNSFYVAINIL